MTEHFAASSLMPSSNIFCQKGSQGVMEAIMQYKIVYGSPPCSFLVHAQPRSFLVSKLTTCSSSSHHVQKFAET
jgi:hypothetical protein